MREEAGQGVAAAASVAQLNKLNRRKTHGCLRDPGRRTGTRSPQSLGLGRNQCSNQHRLWSSVSHPLLSSHCPAFVKWSPACECGIDASRLAAWVPRCDPASAKSPKANKQTKRVAVLWPTKINPKHVTHHDTHMNHQRKGRRKDNR